jgi:hypothetical protein
MKTNYEIKIRLQGHEKFALREGWLAKGLKAVKLYPLVFQKEGTDILGVGTNMVKSIRFWLNVYGLIEENQRSGAKLTSLGEIVFNYDRYFEDIFTIWMLHIIITSNSKEATSWYIFFNKCELEEFDKKTIFNYMKSELSKYLGNDEFSENSLNSDIDVLLSMYSRNKIDDDPENNNISPFVRLELLKKSDDMIEKKRPDIRKVNEWVILLIVSKFLKDENSISIDDAIMSENGIAKITQLSSITINDLLDKLDMMGYIRINRTAGLDMIYRTEKCDYNFDEIVRKYYMNRE